MLVKVRIEGIEQIIKKFYSPKVKQAIQSALNETALSTKTLASDLIRNECGFKIKKSDLDKRLELRLARGYNFTAILSAKRISAFSGMRTGHDSFSLTYFGAKEARRFSGGVHIKSRKGIKTQKRTRLGSGVTVQVLKGGRTARFPRAFIAKMESGHIGVFRRIEGSKMKSKDKAQIREVKVITVASMFSKTLNKLKQHATEYFAKIFQSKLNWKS